VLLAGWGDEHFPQLTVDAQSPRAASAPQDIDEAQQQYTVRAGTLPKLVERLTHPTRADAEHTAAFLLTFRSFATPRELLYLLMQRFQVPPPLNSSSDDKARYAHRRASRFRRPRLRRRC